MTLFFKVFLTVIVSGFCLIVSAPSFYAASLIPNDPYFYKQWSLRQIQVPEAWSITTGTNQVVVAVIDTGVDISHPELRDAVWTNQYEVDGNGVDDDQNGYIDDLHGWNFVANSASVYPMSNQSQLEEAWSHGTAVASIIAAKGNNGIGIAGMAWNVKIMPLVILSADGFGNAKDFARAIDYAIQNGAQIVNMSFVGYEEDSDLTAAIERAHKKGVLLVAATGNFNAGRLGQDLDQVSLYPVCDEAEKDYVVGVGGSDTLDQPALYGNLGSRCTDVVAPSFELFTARPVIHWENDATTTVYGYIEGLSGTSFAAPHVSGLAALIKSVQPTWNADEIKDRLYHTADPIEPGVTPGQKGRLGYGRINAYRALQGLAPETVISSLQKPSVSSSNAGQKGRLLFEQWFQTVKRAWLGL